MFKGGVKDAAKILASMTPSEQKNLITRIRAQDPKMADTLEGNLISIEDVQYLSASMLVGVLRDIPLETFGLALRTVDQNIVQDILNKVSTGIKLDIEDGLKGKPRRVSEVEEAQKEVISLLKKKVDLGHISLAPDSDEYV